MSPVAVPIRTRMATRQQTGNYFEDEDEDMTELQPTFSGPIIKSVTDGGWAGGQVAGAWSRAQCNCWRCLSSRLMVYPPPPAKGGISVTNEDLHCLNDGEFLNDVIIDFYLK